MADDREQVLIAEAFIRESAAQLALAKERSAALANAVSALDRATVQCERVTTSVESQVSALSDTLEAMLGQLQQHLLESDQQQRDTFATGVREARRSILDSAQNLSEAATSISGDIKLLAEFSAREREQWSFTFMHAIKEAHNQLRLASETAASTSQRIAEVADLSVVKLSASAAAIADKVREVEKAAASMRDTNGPAMGERLRKDLRMVRASVFVLAGVQILLLLAVAAIAFRR